MDKKSKKIPSLQLAVIHPRSAAIDVGSMMMIAYSDKAGKQYLPEADAFTTGLYK